MKRNPIRKIKFHLLIQLIAILFLSIYISTMITSPTTAVFQTETELLKGGILASDTYAGYDDPNKVDEAIEDGLENEPTNNLNKQSIDDSTNGSTNGTSTKPMEESNDSNKPVAEEELEQREKDENESQEKDADEEVDDTTGDE
ncbi:hypothetical protein [Oceanobacillus iheyensis HTE831]|uniref:Uncharacterized protein n=1 Tax=Oceanobacillus iheyensis (strain DSM 14371 / CIP 107618 / JCM 11309 / KCTC 3954 / HTE831) TaxID=221109 RepID=Q8ES44_OCEIH|nr:hypothetical protein [Oceanobacillus iheyensis]BAC12755.1 hypothetical protein [Oceanobacillus iheyensis HTE831]